MSAPDLRTRCIGCGDYEDERTPLHNAPCSAAESAACYFVPVDASGMAIPGEHSLECDHCGGDAITKAAPWFADGEGERCKACGFPGHVSVDEDPDGNAASWSMSQDPTARCTDAVCVGCCEKCLHSTGGVCTKHADPEPLREGVSR